MRITVYVPDDLGAALESHKDRINVSGVCQEALRREIAIMSIAHKNATVERLRRSRMADQDSEEREGREAGAEWARDEAEWRELQELSATVSGRAWERIDVEDFGLYRDIGGQEHEVRQLFSREPWDRGFVAGALKVLGAVQDAVLHDGPGFDPGEVEPFDLSKYTSQPDETP